MALLYRSLLLCGILSFMLTLIPRSAYSISMKLIRRDTIDSSLFPKNLTDEERHKIYVDLSNARADYHRSMAVNSIKSQNKNTTELQDPNMIRPIISTALNNFFVVSLSIGSQPYGTLMAIDTGSSLSWVVCGGCTQCFQLKGGGFDYHASNTYQPLPWDDPLCVTEKRIGDICGYEIRYVASSAAGIIGRDTFTFSSTTNTPEGVPGMLFGCSTSTGGVSFGANDGPNNEISGIFGLEPGPLSFLTQANAITQNRFSYCLPPWNQPSNTLLNFGNDIPPLPTGPRANLVRITTMLPFRYYLVCTGISFGEGKLDIDPSVFLIKEDGSGGFNVDSGSTLTRLVPDAYQVVRTAYQSYFYLLHYKPVDLSGTRIPYDLCYALPFQVKNLPSLTFHFQNNADLVVSFWNVFVPIGSNLLCMAILPIDPLTPNLLGATQQANYRFVYDRDANQLTFYPELCKIQ